jgi:hypothetical protein
MNEEEINQKFVDIVIDNFSDYQVDEDLFADTVEYIIPMPAPNIYFISKLEPEQVEEIFNDLLRWLRDGYDF